MRSTAFHIISFIVLIAIAVMFSGLPATASVAQAVMVENTSCNHGNPDSGRECPSPCATSVCPFFLCIAADTVVPTEVQVKLSEMESVFSFISKPIPDPFVNSIFHPPSIV